MSKKRRGSQDPARFGRQARRELMAGMCGRASVGVSEAATGGPKRPSTSPRSGKDVGRDGRMRDAHHRAEGGSTCSGRGEAERTSVRNAELAIEAVALRLARVSRPAPVTETQSLSAVRGTRWSGRRNQTARFAFFGKLDERVEVRRQGVGRNAGSHFRLACTDQRWARMPRARAQSASICFVSASSVSNFASGRR
jgi:hypothetical protein